MFAVSDAGSSALVSTAQSCWLSLGKWAEFLIVKIFGGPIHMASNYLMCKQLDWYHKQLNDCCLRLCHGNRSWVLFKGDQNQKSTTDPVDENGLNNNHTAVFHSVSHSVWRSVARQSVLVTSWTRPACVVKIHHILFPALHWQRVNQNGCGPKSWACWQTSLFWYLFYYEYW